MVRALQEASLPAPAMSGKPAISTTASFHDK
jgi:hypothetical protein